MAHYRALAPADAQLWQLRSVPVCSSTERVLASWLTATASEPLLHPRAVLATHQTHATGQRGKVWSSPRGGVWISAALPWSSDAGDSTGLVGLALAVALAESLEQIGVAVQIKWPNDLLVGGSKLAGLLPRLVVRGTEVRMVRFGLGLNVTNPVPSIATSLRRETGVGPRATPRLAALAMLAMDRCRAWAEQGALQSCLAAAQQRLWSDVWIDPTNGVVWRVDGLSPDGGLCLRLKHTTRCLRRWG